MSNSATRVGCRVQQIVSIQDGRDAFHAKNFTFVTEGMMTEKTEKKKGRRQEARRPSR